MLGQLIQDRLFQIPKACFTVTLKGLANRVTQPILDYVIRIEEGYFQPPGELTTDG
jgi:hypothetical protein